MRLMSVWVIARIEPTTIVRAATPHMMGVQFQLSLPSATQKTRSDGAEGGHQGSGGHQRR